MNRFLLSLLLASFTFLAEAQGLPLIKITYKGHLNYDNYIPGTVTVTDTDGSEVTLNATFKTRGATALQYSMKPSMNMKLQTAEGNELDYNLLGIREASSFILDAMAIDRINMRNRVCFDIWNSFSRLPYESDFGNRNGTVGRFAEVYINNTYKGIYCLTDKINRKMLALKKPKTADDGTLKEIRGVLYKHGTSDIENQDNPGFYLNQTVWVAEWRDAWELHEPDDYPCEEAWAPLVDLYNNRNYENYDYVKKHFYLENLADYTIHVMALAIGDNWGNKNKYFSIVNIQDDTKFVVTPWDLDTSLGGEYNGTKYDGDYLDWPVADIPKSAHLPFATVLKKTEFTDMLKASWERGRENAFAVDSVKQRLQAYCDLFINSGAWQRTVEYWDKKNERELYVDDLQKEIDLIVQWYEKRFDEMDAYFGIDAGVSDITVPSGAEKETIYNLQGIKINEITAPGIYIIDGKKKAVRK